MKRIHLKTVTLTNTQLPEGFKFEYKKELLQIIEIVPEGVTTSQMASALKIQDKLRNAEHSIYLEDADWQWLNSKVAAHKWRLVAKEVVEFVQSIADAKNEEAPHLKTVPDASPEVEDPVAELQD